MDISGVTRANQREIENMKALQASALKDLQKNVITKRISVPALAQYSMRRLIGVTLSNDLGRVPLAVLGVKILTSTYDSTRRILVTRSLSQSTGQVSWVIDTTIPADVAFEMEVQTISSIKGTLDWQDLGGKGDWLG